MIEPYYDDGEGIVVYHGAAEDVLLNLGVRFADAAVFSPPYNAGVEYDGYDDRREWERYAADVTVWADYIAAALAPTGRSFCNVAPVVDDRTGGKARGPLLTSWASALESAGLLPADVIAWTSLRGSGTAWGSWESPSGPNLRGDWEAVLVHFRESWGRAAPPGFEQWRDRIGGWQELVTNVWRLAPASRAGHPAPFPVELAQRCIRLSTWPGQTVLDPFCGSGSTLLAARSLGRRAVGIEQSEEYCALAVARLAQGVLGFGDTYPPVEQVTVNGGYL